MAGHSNAECTRFMSEAFNHGRGQIADNAFMFELLKKINDLSIRKEKNKCYVWSIVFVEPLGGWREGTRRGLCDPAPKQNKCNTSKWFCGLPLRTEGSAEKGPRNGRLNE